MLYLFIYFVLYTFFDMQKENGAFSGIIFLSFLFFQESNWIKSWGQFLDSNRMMSRNYFSTSNINPISYFTPVWSFICELDTTKYYILKVFSCDKCVRFNINVLLIFFRDLVCDRVHWNTLTEAVSDQSEPQMCW